MQVIILAHLFFFRKKGKNIFQKLKSAKRRTDGVPDPKGESAAPSELSLALSLTKKASAEEEEAESRDMAEAEEELNNSPLEVQSEASVGVLGVAVLSSAATFCCGGQEAASKLRHSDEKDKSTVKKNTAGTSVIYGPSERFFLCLFSLPLLHVYFQGLGGRQQAVQGV